MRCFNTWWTPSSKKGTTFASFFFFFLLKVDLSIVSFHDIDFCESWSFASILTLFALDFYLSSQESVGEGAQPHAEFASTGCQSKKMDCFYSPTTIHAICWQFTDSSFCICIELFCTGCVVFDAKESRIATVPQPSHLLWTSPSTQCAVAT